MTAGTKPLRLYVCDGGTIRTKVHLIKAQQQVGEDYEIPIPWYVITHPRGHTLVDGGAAAPVADDPVSHLGDELCAAFWPVIGAADTVEPTLERLGIAFEEVRWIVQTHLHWDHTGAVARASSFPDAQAVATRNEFDYAHTPDWYVAPGYVQADFGGPGIDWLLLEDTDDGVDLYGDGSVRLWRTPGHSPGHQSVEVNLPSGRSVLLAGDAAYTDDHWEHRALPGTLDCTRDVVRSVRRLRYLAWRRNALVILGHDPDRWPTLTRAPAFYT